MLIVEFSITPLDKGESVSPWVAKAVDVIARSGLDYQLGPMGTCIEGEWSEVMAVIQQCYEVLNKESTRLTFSIKGDWKKTGGKRLKHKVKRVEEIIEKRGGRG